MKILMVVFLVSYFCQAFCEEHCKCQDPSYQSSWGEFTPTSTCHGKCNGLEKGKRECFARKNDVIFAKSYCDVERACHNPKTCEGYWSTWSNIGSCSSSCDQVQARYCYKNASALLIRNRFCIGSNGKSEQNRHRFCNHGACDLANAGYRKEETSTFGIRLHASSSTVAPQTISSSRGMTNASKRVLQKDDDEPSSGDGAIDPITDIKVEKPESSSILLIAILGSVGLVSLSAVLFGIVFVVLKRKRKRNDSRIRIGPGAEPNRYVTKTQVDDIYTTMGPALPDRPPRREAPSPHMNGRVYETTEKDLELHKPGPEADNYLLPDLLKNSEKNRDEDCESIYWNIDERR